MPLEKITLNSGEILMAHRKEDCAGPCALHGPSDHHMKEWPLHWREDRQFLERVCKHGVGHPDPDSMRYIFMKHGQKKFNEESIHGCDGCCTPPPAKWSPST